MILIKPGDHAAPIPLRLHTGQTMAAKNTNRCSLHVEWTEGAERRYGSPPVVIVDGQPVGAVDQLIAISPGDHRVRVRRERATTDEIQVTVPPSRTFVLHYESSEVSPIFHGAMTAIALVTSLVIYWVFDVGAFEREETLRNKLIAAAGIGVVVLAHRCLSPYFFRGTLKAGRPALAVSVAGGDLQDQATLNVLLDFIDFGMMPEDYDSIVSLHPTAGRELDHQVEHGFIPYKRVGMTPKFKELRRLK